MKVETSGKTKESTVLPASSILIVDDEQPIRRVLGSELVQRVPDLASAAPLVRAIQERMDGRGYPDGRSAADIPLAVRILSAADAYDAMTHPRVFRDPIDRANALLELERCAGSQFDPDVVAALHRAVAASD